MYAMPDYAYNVSVPTKVDMVYASVEIMCAIVAVIGNLLVITVFVKYVVLRTVTNYYVISLATADLLVGLFGIPSAIATSVGLPANFLACIFMNSFLMLLCTASILSLVAVTIDRFWAIIFPLTYTSTMTSRKAVVIIVASWTAATAIGLLPTLGWNNGRPPEARCFFMEVMSQRYLVFIYFATIVVPSTGMACIYARIYTAVRKQVRRMSKTMVPHDVNYTSDSPSLPIKVSYSQAKAAKSIFVVVLLFTVSWIPLYTINAVLSFCDGCNAPTSLIKAAIVLSHFNSAWNPLLYAWGMNDFRYCLWRMLACKQSRLSTGSCVMSNLPRNL